MAYQVRDQHIQNHRAMKKNHGFSMKELPDSLEKKAFSSPSEFRASAPQ